MAKTESWIVDLETEILEYWPTDEELDAVADAIFRSKVLAGPVPGANAATRTLSLKTAIDERTGDLAVNRVIAQFYVAIAHAGLRPAKVVTIDVRLDPGDGVDPQELVSGGDVARRLGLSRERVRQLAEDPAKFPRPLAVIGRDRVWRWGDVANWAKANDRKTKLPRRRRAAVTETLDLRAAASALRSQRKKSA